MHFLTLSRVLPETLQALDLCDLNTMSRRDIAICVWLAFDDPLQEKGPGRPRGCSEGLVKKLVVFKETHADGDFHFHVVVLQYSNCSTLD